MLETVIILDHCKSLKLILLDDDRFESVDKEDLSQAVYHAHICLAKRVALVIQESCRFPVHDKAPSFHGTPFDIPMVISVLNALAKSSKASTLF